LKPDTGILKKHGRRVKLSKSDTYTHLSNAELIENLKRLIKKANSTESLNPKPAREILLEDRR